MIKIIQLSLIFSIFLIANENTTIQANIKEANISKSLLDTQDFSNYLSAINSHITNTSNSINTVAIVIAFISAILTIFAIGTTLYNNTIQGGVRKKLEKQLEETNTKFITMQDDLHKNIKNSVDLQVSIMWNKKSDKYSQYFKDKLNLMIANISGNLLAIESIVNDISEDIEKKSEARFIFLQLIHLKNEKVNDGITRLKQKIDDKEWEVNNILFEELWNNIPNNYPIKSDLILKDKISDYFICIT